VFTSGQELEKKVLDVSRVLLKHFHEICSDNVLNRIINRKNVCGFCATLKEYMKAFDAWRQPDEADLLERVKVGLTGLYGCRDMAVEGSRQMVELEHEITRLRGSMIQLVGQAGLDAFLATLPCSTSLARNTTTTTPTIIIRQQVLWWMVEGLRMSS
jgi:hypothetical protein